MKTKWINKTKKSLKNYLCVGRYQFNGGDRSFVLIDEKTKRQISYESFQAAKRDGWEIKR